MEQPRFSLRDIQQDYIEGGFTIITTTDVPCHLWLRYTSIVPQKHLVPVLRRGLFMHADAYFCFVNYKDIEQNEAGDTLTHTFTWLDWHDCLTQYFYFWGTIATETAVSTSGYFKKHYWPYPKTSIFYPDAHPEVTSVDGHAGQQEFLGGGKSWVDLLDAPGNTFNDEAVRTALFFTAYDSDNPDKWRYFHRSIFLFDTSSLGVNAQIISASLALVGSSKQDDLACQPDFNVYSSQPHSDTALENGDYRRLFYIPWSDIPIDYPDFHLEAPNVWPLNAYGLSQISLTGITRLGIRSPHRDIHRIAPTWAPGQTLVEAYTSGIADERRPALSIYYNKIKPPQD